MSKKPLTILGIETSCDETAAALLQLTTNNQQLPTFKILSNIVSSQVKIHAKYGGIVPEVAARHHAENIIPVLAEAMASLNSKSEIRNPKQIQNPKFKILNSIDAIAVTVGPGLITSLLVGVEAAKTLAFLAKKPLIPVNHLVAHIYANFLHYADSRGLDADQRGLNADPRGKIENCKLKIENLFPAVCLVVSGGHTELILMRDFEKFKKIGQTLDDAAGECFDKAAKILGLGYPGGPAIAAEAAKIPNIKSQIPNKFQAPNSKFQIQLPRPMINSGDFNFSFSGLKTAVLYKVKDFRFKIKDSLPEFCYEIQQAIIDVLIAKTLRAAKKYKVKSIILGGGVVANDELRKQFESKVYSLSFSAKGGSASGGKVKFFAPAKNLCTDNAAMITAAGYFKLKKTSQKEWLKKFDWQKIRVNPNLEI